jgi:hypothetical protein
VRPPARRGAFRFVAVVAAILALAAGMIARPALVTTASAGAHRSSTEPAATLQSNDAVPGRDTVGVQPHRRPTVARAPDVAGVRSVMFAVAMLAAGAACVGISLWFCRRADEALVRCDPLAWAGPGGRRAPPLAPAT